jgi:antitoxin (DNA-binding transcriptional repressor) of toxin-antitoxin stability system
MQVTIHEAKTHLSRLIAAVERGEEVVIARRDKPVVEIRLLAPAPEVKRSRGCGGLAGYLSAEVIEYLTHNPSIDREIEEDFMQAVEKPWSQ